MDTSRIEASAILERYYVVLKPRRLLPSLLLSSNGTPQIKGKREFRIAFFNWHGHRTRCVSDVKKSGETTTFRLVRVDGKLLKTTSTGMHHMVSATPAALACPAIDDIKNQG